MRELRCRSLAGRHVGRSAGGLVSEGLLTPLTPHRPCSAFGGTRYPMQGLRSDTARLGNRQAPPNPCALLHPLIITLALVERPEAGLLEARGDYFKALVGANLWDGNQVRVRSGVRVRVRVGVRGRVEVRVKVRVRVRVKVWVIEGVRFTEIVQ